MVWQTVSFVSQPGQKCKNSMRIYCHEHNNNNNKMTTENTKENLKENKKKVQNKEIQKMHSCSVTELTSHHQYLTHERIKSIVHNAKLRGCPKISGFFKSEKGQVTLLVCLMHLRVFKLKHTIKAHSYMHTSHLHPQTFPTYTLKCHITASAYC